MLVLSRKPSDVIMIGDDIEIQILSIDKNNVRVGINAPKSISVHRKEVYDKINSKNEE